MPICVKQKFPTLGSKYCARDTPLDSEEESVDEVSETSIANWCRLLKKR